MHSDCSEAPPTVMHARVHLAASYYPRHNARCICKSWTGLSVEETVRMTEDRDKWRKYVHGVANPRIEDG